MKKTILLLLTVCISISAFAGGTQIPNNTLAKKIHTSMESDNYKYKKYVREKQFSELEEKLHDDMIEEINKLKRVNYFFNKFRYISDIKLYNRIDYWASPYDFNLIRKGDCEDYALAKMFILKKNNFNRPMKIVKTYNEKNVAHAILLIETEDGKEYLVLDNSTDKVKLLKDTHYHNKIYYEYSHPMHFDRYLTKLSEEEKRILLN